jgi:diacylglycerol kinase (ATP)
MTAPPPKSTKGAIRHLWGAFGYSMAGARFLFSQRAARLQTAMFGATVVAFLAAGVGPVQWAVATALFLASLGVEALNTAIELTVDRVSPELSTYGKHAKDLGSFAVFCALVIFGGHAVWAVIDAAWL